MHFEKLIGVLGRYFPPVRAQDLLKEVFLTSYKTKNCLFKIIAFFFGLIGC